jgi:Na+-driven multidrug efflux pump
VIALGTEVIRIILLMIPIVGVQIISASLFQSLGKAKPALILSMLRQTLLLIPLVLILPRIFDLGLFGIWLAFPISDGFSTIISVTLLIKEMKLMNSDHEKRDDSSLVKKAS